MKKILKNLFNGIYNRKKEIINHNYDSLINLTFKNKKKLTFVQIGAMDGKSFDPIYKYIQKYKWKGILVEPLPDYFQELKANYLALSENLIFENFAIDVDERPKKIYRIDPIAIKEGLVPEWAKGVSSFYVNRNAIGGRLISEKEYSNLKKYIIEEIVDCISFNTLLKKNNFKKFDLLQIDTEGHDYQILRQVDLRLHTPKMIVLEYYNLPDDEKLQCMNLLKDHSYYCYDLGKDLIGVKR